MMIAALIAVLLGYLLGSFPSAYIVGRLWGRKDVLAQGDGHIGATAAYKTMGLAPFVIVILADAAKGIAAVYLASALTDSTAVMAAAGFAAVIGHCWSVFIGFRGGLGAVVTYGTLVGLVPLAFALGAVVTIPVLLVTRRSTISTYVLLATTSIVLWTQQREMVLVLLPVALIIIQQVKRFQALRGEAPNGYQNELSHDLKKPKYQK